MAAGQISDQEPDNILQSLFRETVKVKRFYDANTPPRCIQQFEAPQNAINNGPCLLTTYTYVGITTNVDAMKETESQWNSSWDI